MEQGLTHIYCGDGKGKTTAACGLAARALGNRRRVLMLQFLKDGTSGELNSLRSLPGFTLLPAKKAVKFTFQMSEEELADTAKFCSASLEQAFALAAGYDLLLLDEIFAACSCGLVNTDHLVELIHAKPASLELVLTGRNPPECILELADYVSEIQKIKHPYDKGIPARQGIEY